MIVYRLSSTRWARSLDGEGARLYGGRWNEMGTPCVYTSQNRALALLEYSVNIEIHNIPRALSMISIEVPDDYYANPLALLPGDWRSFPAPASTQAYGTSLLKASRHCVLQFPSTIIPEENNYLINPLHMDARRIKILDVSDFIYDLRIKAV